MTFAKGMRKVSNTPFIGSESDRFAGASIGGITKEWLAAGDLYVGDQVFLNAGVATLCTSATEAQTGIGTVVGGDLLNMECPDENTGTYQGLQAAAAGQVVIVAYAGIVVAYANAAITQGARVTGAAGGRVSVTSVAAGNILGYALDAATLQNDRIRLFMALR